jgi:hypothetical protein
MNTVHTGVSPKLELNGEQFSVSDLEPFGKELIPERSGGVNIQDLILRDVNSMIAAAREEKVLIISHVTSTDDQEWCEIKPRAQNICQIPHLDYSGRFPLLFWTINGKEREPTAFSEIDDFVCAMQQNSQLLSTPTLSEVDENSGWLHTIEYIRQNLHDLSRIDFRAPEELNRRLLLDKKYDALLSTFPSPGLIDVLISKITGRNRNAERAKLNRDRDVCLDAMQSFAREVTNDLEPKSLVHRWKDKPESGVIAYNLASTDAQKAQPVVHFGLHDMDIMDPCMLRRAEIAPNREFHIWKGQ